MGIFQRFSKRAQMGSLSEQLTGSKINVPKVKNEKLPEGLAGNLRTIQVMQKVARERAGHPLVREYALKIIQVARVPSHNYAEEALAIGDFVKRRVRYTRDPRDHELLQDPVMMIEKLEKEGFTSGDCDDMSLLIATLLLAIGHSPKFRAVRYSTQSGHYNHIYVVVYERNFPEKPVRVVLDAILKDQPIGTEVKHTSGKEYPV